MIWVDLLLVPCCALLAVMLTALLLNEDADDRSLMRYFMVIFSLAMLMSLGVLSRPSMQRALSPELARAHELEMHPIYQLVKERAAQSDQRWAEFIRAEMAQGTPIPEIFVRARPLLEHIALDYLGFAEEEARLAWGRVALETLQALKTRDPLACFARVTHADMDSPALRSGLSAENSAAFQSAFIAVVESGYAGMGDAGKAPSEKLEFAEVQKRYGEIMAPLEARFGREAYQFLAGMRFGAPAPVGDEAAVCALRIAQLELALKERPAMAARILDSLLR